MIEQIAGQTLLRRIIAALDRRSLEALVVIGVVLTAIAWFAPAIHRVFGGNVWMPVQFGWGLLAALALWVVTRTSHPAALAVIIGVTVLIRLAMLAEPPYLSTDIYRYVWDGRVAAAGINPYRYLPAAPELATLRDAAIYPHINRADYAPTIYPPVAQMVFRAVHLFGDGVLTMRLGMLAFEALTIAALIGILRAMALPAERVVAFAWHPLPAWEIAGNGHVDAAMVGLLLAGMMLYLGAIRAGKSWSLPAGVLVALAAFVKPTALLAMPVMWRPWDWKLPAVLAGVAAAVYLPYLSAGTHVFGFLGGYADEEGFADGSGFRYVALAEYWLGHPVPVLRKAYMVLASAILIGLALRAGFRAGRSVDAAMQALGALLIAFMLLLTPHYPWYYLVLVPLLATGRWLTPWVLTAGGCVLYNQFDTPSMPPLEWRETALHVAALTALACDIRRARFSFVLPLVRHEVPS